MILPSEGFAAYVTRVRSLICMCSLMNQKIVGLGEMPLAEFANKLFLGSKTKRYHKTAEKGERVQAPLFNIVSG